VFAYKYLSLSDHYFTISHDDQSMFRFEKVLDWYLENETEHKKVEQYMLEYFKPNCGYNDALRAVIQRRADTTQQINRLVKLCEALKIFGRNELMVTHIC
jgi:hypothetical protein